MAIRDKDQSKIKYFGAFASALSYILNSANKYRRDQNKVDSGIILYRGLKMT